MEHSNSNRRIKNRAGGTRGGAGGKDDFLSKIHFLDLWTLMLEQEGGEDVWSTFLLNDGLHLSEAGQEFVGQQLLHLLDSHVTEVEKLPAELPWGSDVNVLDFEASFRAHQAKSSSERVGLGTKFFGVICDGSNSSDGGGGGRSITISISEEQGMLLFVIVILVFMGSAVWTFISYFQGVGYFRVNKDN